MKNELEFVKMLVEKYHYPKEAIKTDVPDKFKRFDVLIQKGNVYIQAFEVKLTTNIIQYKEPIQNIARSLNEFSVDTPIYIATMDEKGEWKVYSPDDLTTPLDIKNILNYQEAYKKFWGLVKDSLDEIPSMFYATCWICASIIMIYIFLCILCDLGILMTVYGSAPLSGNYIILLIILIVLALLPSTLKMSNRLKKFKIGLFELEFKN